ncbi:MAG: ArsR family transcriptional regulator [Chloroflexota bacterium]|nr:ArsR family transcriptional regulator [Chloroflexota bacterium]
MAPPKWGFLTNHALVLVYVVLHSESTVRQVSADVGITERATLAILRDLDADGIIDRHRDGRRNTYSVDFEHLASVRRGGTESPLTPRLFVDGVIKMLYDMADRPEGAPRQPRKPRVVGSEELKPRVGSWGFFTNHLLLVLAMARHHTKTVRDLATTIGITERAVVGIVNQLEDEGIVTRTREGRRNSYSIDYDAFHDFRSWSFGSWSLPAPLIDAATNGVRSVAAT